MSDARKRYRAFISYSHADRRKAMWLHRRLELLKSSVGGKKERPLRPIFLDRDELPASPDLSHDLRAALDQSDRLIVLCSPSAATSAWMDKEVQYFLERRSAAEVLCVIVGGDLDAPVRSFLPASLARSLEEDSEPLAADLRQAKDGSRLAVFKIAAALLHVRVADLLQRDARRRIRMLTLGVLATAALSLAMGALAFVAWKANLEAQRHNTESESLIAYMVDDLAAQLEPVGRLDVLDGVGVRVLAHYERNPPGRDDAALQKRAHALMLVAKVRDTRGDLKGARAAFAMAAATTARRLKHEPEDGERLFDHAQNVFWLAYTSWRLGEDRPAETGFREYLELSRDLVRRHPDRPDWRLEPAYAESNLGTLLFEGGRTAEALTAFVAARDVFAQAYAADPGNADRLKDLADAQAWVADALVRLGRLHEALNQRRLNADRVKDHSVRNPSDRPMAARAWAAQSAVSRRELDLGVASGVERAMAARNGLKMLIAFDPANTTWREYAAQSEMDLVDFALAAGHVEAARASNREASRLIGELQAVNPNVVFWRTSLDWRNRKQGLLLSSGMAQQAAALDLMARTATGEGEDGERASARAASFAALNRWNEVVETLAGTPGDLLPADKALLAHALKRPGRNRTADIMLQELGKSGYVPPQITAYSPANESRSFR